MKKIILLALTALMMVGCDYTPTNHITSDGKRVVLIDSCEYVKWSNGWGGDIILTKATADSVQSAESKKLKNWLNN